MQICCIIKPPHFFDRRAIIAAVQEKRLLILKTSVVHYTSDLIDTLYDHMDEPARDAIKDRYRAKPGYAVLLSAPCIEVCLAVVGRESNPCACEPGTIRHTFGWHSTAELVGKWQWWENAIHRPVDERERVRDLKHIFPPASSSR